MNGASLEDDQTTGQMNGASLEDDQTTGQMNGASLEDDQTTGQMNGANENIGFLFSSCSTAELGLAFTWRLPPSLYQGGIVFSQSGSLASTIQQ
ncbi:hypothetical protein KUCAC02_001408 [Chaenocephalus aceratus]|uniref:Uncharacterized protein n=1 Tax=Chaenocephalus aceratus TaxID=36190 RepID=A0ACB9XQH6_CHAAC|nr:hypothetical protein KUCAC02_001408 [Chaenocephalus aceratus]